MATNSQINPSVFTTTQNSSGQSVFTEMERKAFSNNLVVLYGSDSLPVNITDDADLQYHSKTPIELVPKEGCQVFLFRIQPGGKDAPVTRLHRNLSIDIGVMIAGSGMLTLGMKLSACLAKLIIRPVLGE
jgi:hypothetical protein